MIYVLQATVYEERTCKCPPIVKKDADLERILNLLRKPLRQPEIAVDYFPNLDKEKLMSESNKILDEIFSKREFDGGNLISSRESLHPLPSEAKCLCELLKEHFLAQIAGEDLNKSKYSVLSSDPQKKISGQIQEGYESILKKILNLRKALHQASDFLNKDFLQSVTETINTALKQKITESVVLKLINELTELHKTLAHDMSKDLNRMVIQSLINDLNGLLGKESSENLNHDFMKLLIDVSGLLTQELSKGLSTEQLKGQSKREIPQNSKYTLVQKLAKLNKTLAAGVLDKKIVQELSSDIDNILVGVPSNILVKIVKELTKLCNPTIHGIPKTVNMKLVQGLITDASKTLGQGIFKDENKKMVQGLLKKLNTAITPSTEKGKTMPLGSSYSKGKIGSKSAMHDDTSPKSAKHGDTGLKSAKNGDTSPKSAEKGDAGPKSAKHGDTGLKSAKHGDTSPKSAKYGDTSPKSAKNGDTSLKSAKNGDTSLKSAKHGDTSPKSAKHGDTSPKSAKHGDTGLKSAKHGDTSPKSAKKGDAGPKSAKHGDTGLKSAKHGDTSPKSAKNGDASSKSAKHGDTSPKSAKHGDTSPKLAKHGDLTNLSLSESIVKKETKISKSTLKKTKENLRPADEKNISTQSLSKETTKPSETLFRKLIKINKKNAEKIKLQKQRQLEMNTRRLKDRLSMKSVTKEETPVSQSLISEMESESTLVCGDPETQVPKHMISGDKVVALDTHYKDKKKPRDHEPLLFETRFEFRKNEPIPIPKPEHRQLPKYSRFVYQLSNEKFIHKGWTMLPTQKMMRMMNVYRMKPVNPKNCWFNRHKHIGRLLYDSGTKMADIDLNGSGCWYYRNGTIALEYYNAEESNIGQRVIVYSCRSELNCGETTPRTILALFDGLGNGVVYDEKGKTRLKYNQSEGVVVDPQIGPTCKWKWHTLNDPPILQQVFFDTYLKKRDPRLDDVPIPPEGEDATEVERSVCPDLLNIELNNLVNEQICKLKKKFKPLQITMKTVKLNAQFSLKILNQSTIYLLYRDGCRTLKLNLGLLLDSTEIIDRLASDVEDIATPYDNYPAKTKSVENIKKILNSVRSGKALPSKLTVKFPFD